MKQILWKKLHLDNEEQEELEEDFDEDIDEYEEELTFNQMMTPMKMLTANKLGDIHRTPFGFFHIKDELHPYRIYDLWIGHINFDLTEKIKNIIEKCDGVEILIPMSRYRFMLGIGTAFDTKDVLVDIQTKLGIVGTIHKNKTNSENIAYELVQEKCIEIEKTHPNYFLYMFPNGETIFTNVTEENSNDFRKFFLNLKKMSNGILIDKGLNESI